MALVRHALRRGRVAPGSAPPRRPPAATGRAPDRRGDCRRPGLCPRPRCDPQRHQAGEPPPGAGTRPARRLRHRQGHRGHRRGAHPGRLRGRHPQVHAAGTGRRRGAGCSQRPLLARLRALRDARRRRSVHRTFGPGDHRQEHARAGPGGTGRPARGTRGTGGADHPEPLRRALRPVPLGRRPRRGPGGEHNRGYDSGGYTCPRPFGDRRAGARPRRLPAPRLGRGACPVLRRQSRDSVGSRGPRAACGHLRPARARRG